MTMLNYSELISQFEGWISNPATSKNIGSHASVVRNVASEIVGQHDLLLKNSIARPTIAIFGPSQSGKSYLTAKICERDDETVSVMIDKNYDFLREINPAGGRESTALVTRMTTQPNGSRKSGLDEVNASLLSLPDLIAVFVNIYFNDLKHSSDVSRDLVASRIKSICGQGVLDKAHNANSWIDPDLVYLQRILGYLPLDLKPYTDLLRLPKGSLREKDAKTLTELFSLMWGDISELSALFEHLCEHLLKLKFATFINIPVRAFVPREGSIIDVAALSELQKVSSYDAQLIEIMTEHGISVKLPKPILCALISEVEFQLDAPKTRLLDSVDILDFPGARSRIRRDIKQYETGDTDKLFLRGKISHLFESAASRDEIDTLLLCVKPGPMDIATLPDTINRWLDGVSENQITSRLFILATQFDLHFPDAAGQSKVDQERFDNAIFSAILEPFAPTEESWLYKFNFKNIFPIRNPNYPYDSFFIYDKNGKEVNVREDKLERISQLEKSFTTTRNVTSHISKIPEKWDSLMSPGDGGAYFLIGDLANIDWTSFRSKRIKFKQDDLIEQFISLLEPFAIHDDISKKLDQEKQKFLQFFNQLQQLVEKRMFAPFTELFSISPLDLKASVSSNILSGDEKEEAPSRVSGVQIPGFLKGAVTIESKTEHKSPKGKFFERVVYALLVAWIEELENRIKNCDESLMPYQDAMTYLNSHFTTKHQLEKLNKELMTLSSDWSTGLKLTDNLEPLCMIAAQVLERHFVGPSFEKSSENECVIANPVTNRFTVEKVSLGNVDFFNDWMDHIGKIIEENVYNASGGDHDFAMNAQLLQLLSKAETRLATLQA